MKFKIAHVSLSPKMLLLWITYITIFLLLTACQQLPTTPHLIKSQLLTQQIQQSIQNNSTLVNSISKKSIPSSNISGYYPIITGSDAFASRSTLTHLAKKYIDVQYYIWQDDEAGQLMLKDLYNAANRGVKVRLLLDDLNTNPILDQQLLAFSQHQNIAVRLINPKLYRTFLPINFATSLPRVHRRMHNKSMTFDKQISIIGGRNVGDEYLRSDTKNQFADLDVMLIGNVVKDINRSFDSYWNSELSFDIETLVKPTENKVQQPFIYTLNKISPTLIDSPLISSASIYKKSMEHSHIDTDILTKNINFRWAKILFVADDVKKLQKKDYSKYNLVNQLRNIFGKPQKEFTIISSYFVPTKNGVKDLAKLAHDGVKIKILTNSFDATDVATVHAGYSETRSALLQAGIELYELKSTAYLPLKRKNHIMRSHSATSLHTKTFAVDNRAVFIGSYNIDPRSANINTELGVVIFDSTLAKHLHSSVGPSLLPQAYQVLLTSSNSLAWQTIEGEPPLLHTNQNEPNMSLVNQIWIKLFSILPIDWLL